MIKFMLKNSGLYAVHVFFHSIKQYVLIPDPDFSQALHFLENIRKTQVEPYRITGTTISALTLG